MIPTDCNSDAGAGPRGHSAIARGRGNAAPAPATAAARPAHLRALTPETRAYFRCAPLEATLSVQQCRANRERLSPRQALALPFDLPSWWVQPLACWSCALAPRVEAGAVPFYTAEEVLAGAARCTAPAGVPGSGGAPLPGTPATHLH